jgi:hypothetical protein
MPLSRCLEGVNASSLITGMCAHPTNGPVATRNMLSHELSRCIIFSLLQADKSARYQELLREVGGTPEAKKRRERDRLRGRERDRERSRNRHKVPALQAVPEHHPHDAVSNARRAFSPASVCSARSVELGVMHFHPESAESMPEVRLNNTAPVSQPRFMVQAWTARCSNRTKRVQRLMIR